MDSEEMTPSLEILRYVEKPLHSELLPYYRQLAAVNWNDKITPEVLINEIASGAISVWQMADGRPGLALLRIEAAPSHKTLVLDGLAGHNVVGQAQRIGRDLRTLARILGCSRIECSATDPRWQAVAKRLGFAPVSVNYSMKVD